MIVYPKWHLDQFIRFARLTCDQQTEIHIGIRHTVHRIRGCSQYVGVHLCQIWCLYHKMHNRFAMLPHYLSCFLVPNFSSIGLGLLLCGCGLVIGQSNETKKFDWIWPFDLEILARTWIAALATGCFWHLDHGDTFQHGCQLWAKVPSKVEFRVLACRLQYI